MRKGPDCDKEKRNISVVICDTDTPYHMVPDTTYPRIPMITSGANMYMYSND